MASFSVVRDDGHADAQRRKPAAVPSAPFRRAPLARKIHIELPREPAVQAHAAAEALPPLVLELPDLIAAAEQSADRWQTLGNRVFWAGIVLGALLAIALAWNPGRKAQPAPDAAPTWSPKSSTQLPQHDANATANAANRDSHAPAWPAVSRVAPAEPEAAPPVSVAPSMAPTVAENANPSSAPAPPQTNGLQPEQAQQTELEGPPPGREAAPSFDEWSRPMSGQRPVHTAEQPKDTRWDGTAPQIEPGQAAPVGRIINQR